MENSNIVKPAAPSLLRISPEDNVMVAVRTLEPGTLLEIDGRTVPLGVRLELGHKVAARDLAAGDFIIKYGASIGSATTAIKAGEPVHLHNMKSDYLPTYLRGKEAGISHGH